jgi:sialate O-acetylesterase
MKRCVSIVLACGMLLVAAAAQADVKLPAIFSDHMVLQSGVEAPVWGWADPGEEVTVSVGEQSAKATAGADGKWSVKLPKLAAGGPHTLAVKGKANALAVKDVLVGEVWLGSGQSNMAMVVNTVKDGPAEVAASDFPQIRMFTVTSVAATTAQDDCTGTWEVCSPRTVGRYSATLYFCGREIHKALAVPVGLINSSVGGTPIESWISPEAQTASPELKEFVATQRAEFASFDPVVAKANFEKALAKWQADAQAAKAAGKEPPRRPVDPVGTRLRKGDVGGLFNGKIAPLVPYAIRGAVWYQGEANSTIVKSHLYQHQLPLLVKDWRTRWGYEFPFAWVQLPNYDGAGREWPVTFPKDRGRGGGEIR